MKIKNKSIIIIILITILIISTFGISVSSRNQNNESNQHNLNSNSRNIADSPWPVFQGNVRHTGLSPYKTNFNNGEVKWRYNFDAGYYSSPVIGPNNEIYISSYDHILYAIYPNGELKWNYTLDEMSQSTPAIASDGTIYLTSGNWLNLNYDNYLYAIDANGNLKWRFSVRFYSTSSPVIDSNGTIYFGGNDRLLHAINPDGTEKWNSSYPDGWIRGSPAIGSDGSIYVTTDIQTLLAFNPNGNLKWRFYGEDFGLSTPTVGDDGTIYAISGGFLYAIYPNSTLKWSTEIGSRCKSSVAIGPDETIYVGFDDSYLYSINPNGKIKWKFKTNGNITSSPAISADGTIYFGSNDENFYALNPDGSLKWEIETGRMISCNPAIDSNGIVYFSSHNDFLYAIGSDPISSPMNFTLTPGDGYINLNWDKPVYYGKNKITNYQIYRGNNTSDLEKHETIDDILFYHDTNVINGQTYYYQISAINKNGEGKLSETLNATPIGEPDVPQNLQITTGDEYIFLSWEPPLNNGGTSILGYIIYRRTNSEHEKFLTNDDILYYNDTSLTNGQEYFYQISATNIIGEGPLTSEIQATPMTIPEPPQNLKAIAGDGLIDLSWETPIDNGGSGLLEYEIFRGTISGNEVYFTNLSTLQTYYRDLSVTNDLAYYYYITAVNRVGDSNPSIEVSAIPHLNKTVPSKPLNLQATPGIEYIEISWSKPKNDGNSNITGYKVYRGETSNNKGLLVFETSSNKSYLDFEVSEGKTYFYHVVAVNDVGESEPSNEISSTTSNVKIKEESEDNIISIEIIILITIIIIILIILFFFIRKKRRVVSPLNSNKDQTQIQAPNQRSPKLQTPMIQQPSANSKPRTIISQQASTQVLSQPPQSSTMPPLATQENIPSVYQQNAQIQNQPNLQNENQK
jgi:outer membrane protein assembly factor BamB